jgi:hypothetical protein
VIVRACPEHRSELHEVDRKGPRGEWLEPLLFCHKGWHCVALSDFVLLHTGTGAVEVVEDPYQPERHREWSIRKAESEQIDAGPVRWPSRLFDVTHYALPRPSRGMCA